MAKRVQMRDWETPEALAILKNASALTVEQIATQIIGIRKETLYRWCVKSEAIGNALSWQIDEDTRRGVEAELRKNCFDRKMTVKKTKQVLDRSGNLFDLQETKEYVIPGDFRAQTYFLNNRAPGRWSAKPMAQEDGGGDTGSAFLPVPEVMAETEEDDG
ncbi:MAG: hypothetical protein IJD38_09375 [Clostridia bacterium]|nr:hypothetical protein [Clostridia bacterium]